MFAEVIVDITNEALDHTYTFLVPDGMCVRPGDRVRFPFGSGNREKEGFVITLTDRISFDPSRCKPLYAVIENAVSVQDTLIKLAVWMAEEYGTTLNQCLKTVLPVKKTVRRTVRRIDPLLKIRAEETAPLTLNEDQQAAVMKASKAIREGRQETFLLYGVTGSGKTEVYLRLCEEATAKGKQVIFLIPEISLTYQTVSRVLSRFPGRAAILNSRLSAGERFEQYEKCRKGEVDILIGPRSAIFAPFERTGLIIMDEEHEGAYRSETSPRYDTRTVAMKRAELEGCPVIFGSATPSLETAYLAREKRISFLELRSRARAGAVLPETEIIDLRAELDSGNRSIFSRRLTELMKEKLQAHEQIMLFMNRRGYSSFLQCRKCGEAVRCPHCDVSLTLHYDGSLRCHYCGYTVPRMKNCPACGSSYLAPFGTGTEKLEVLVKESFPEASVLRMDADTTANKDGHERILSAFREKKADILIGTQMIVKGHDFPDVTLVGMILADLSLSSPDIRAAERTFQLITQASGRAGRADRPGNVVIQTYQPEHFAVQLAGKQDYSAFFRKEIAFRKLMGYPPASTLLTILLQSKDRNYLDIIAERAASAFRKKAEAQAAEFLGPFDASIVKIKDIYRKIVYIKAGDHALVLALRNEFTGAVREQDPRGLVLLNYDIM